MVFVDEVLRFLSFQETLMYTCLDIDLNSFGKDDTIDEQVLLDFSRSNLESAFTCDQMGSEEKPDSKPAKWEPPTPSEVKYLMSKLDYDNKVWTQLKQTLLSEEVQSSATRPKPTQVNALYRDNYLFTRFEHLFDYEGQYHSYIVARILATDLFFTHYKPN